MVRSSRALFALAAACLLTAGLGPSGLAESAPLAEGISGRIYDRDGVTALRGAVVTAKLITTNQTFVSAPTDVKGNYLITRTPPGIYAFSFAYKGGEYVVTERLDARLRALGKEGSDGPLPAGIHLEVCFRKDNDSEKTALVIRGECQSELSELLSPEEKDRRRRGILFIIAGGAAAAATLGVLAVTTGTEASSIVR